MDEIGAIAPNPLTYNQIKKLADSIVILIDTREKQNKHILKFLDYENIKYQSYTFKFADYSFMLPANKKLGIAEDVYFDNRMVIERKNSIEELCGNIGTNRERFKRELDKAGRSKFTLLIENATYAQMVQGKYKSKVSIASLIATLATFEARYNIIVKFMPEPSFTGHYMYYTFKNWLREWLKGVEL